jgi:hypothetical protein
VPFPVEPVEDDPVPEVLPRRVDAPFAHGWTAAAGRGALMTEALSAAFDTWSATWLWTTWLTTAEVTQADTLGVCRATWTAAEPVEEAEDPDGVEVPDERGAAGGGGDLEVPVP